MHIIIYGNYHPDNLPPGAMYPDTAAVMRRLYLADLRALRRNLWRKWPDAVVELLDSDLVGVLISPSGDDDRLIVDEVRQVLRTTLDDFEPWQIHRLSGSGWRFQ